MSGADKQGEAIASLQDALGNGADEQRWPPGADYRMAAADVIRAFDSARDLALDRLRWIEGYALRNECSGQLLEHAREAIRALGGGP